MWQERDIDSKHLKFIYSELSARFFIFSSFSLCFRFFPLPIPFASKSCKKKCKSNRREKQVHKSSESFSHENRFSGTMNIGQSSLKASTRESPLTRPERLSVLHKHRLNVDEAYRDILGLFSLFSLYSKKDDDIKSLLCPKIVIQMLKLKPPRVWIRYKIHIFSGSLHSFSCCSIFYTFFSYNLDPSIIVLGDGSGKRERAKRIS